jgi:cysteine-rich repeat protein
MRALAVVAALPSCVNVDAFVCANDGDCRRGDEQGICEDTQYCSYLDDACASGRRYSDLAADLANDCTDEAMPSSSSSSESSSSSSSSSSSTTIVDSSGIADPFCGDGTEDADEECDDGNDRDGDGCNADCVRSGALLWSVVVPGSAGAVDSGQAITTIASGGVAVAGYLRDSASLDDVWVARYAEDGTESWTRTFGNATADDRGFGITQASSADLFVGGVVREGGTRHAWVGIVSPTGEPVDEVQLVGFEVQSVSAFSNRIVAVGKYGNGAFAEALQLQGESIWRVVTEEPSDYFYAVHTVGTEEAYVAGRTLDDAWLARATPMGIETIDTRDGAAADVDWAQAVIADDERVFAAGLLVSGPASDIWIAAYDLGTVGAPAWEYDGCTEATVVQEEAEALAIEPSGDLIVAGFTTVDDRDAWLSRLTVEGECVWARSYPELEEDSTARSVAIGPDGRMYVTGEITGPDGSIDAWVAAFAP